MNNISNQGTTYIIGAGMAGLSAAVASVQKGHTVRLFEATNHAGGRCRSFDDAILGRVIDNGNHLILKGNSAIQRFLESIGSTNGFEEVDPVKFEFIDVDADERWSLKPSAGRIPWWILLPNRRIPGTSLKDYLDLRKIKSAENETVGELIDPARPIFDRFWQPLCQAVLNTDAEEASASSLWAMLEKTLLQGEDASRPMIAKSGLSAALVDPATEFLIANDVAPQFSMRLRSIEYNETLIQSLQLGDETIKISTKDKVIFALPPNEVSTLLPDINVPTETRAIVNVHFQVDNPPALPNNAPFLGMIGSTSHWLFRRGDVFSVTISSADELAKKSNEEIGKIIWQEVAKVIGRDAHTIPPTRVIKEQRATIAQTPIQNQKRPDSATPWQNLFLAGDWTNTGLPATIEGAVLSGQKAAELL